MLLTNSTTPRRRPAILAHHAVAAHLHAHRVAVGALVARIALQLRLGAALVEIGGGGRAGDGVEFAGIEGGRRLIDLQRCRGP